MGIDPSIVLLVLAHHRKEYPLLEVPYYQAARFPNKKAAGTVYTKVQDLIYQDVTCDLSAYRVKLGHFWHVVAIGEKPADRLHVQIEAQLTNGELVSLGEDALLYLLDRRAQAIQLGPWVEGHYDVEEGE
jgi:hypothetical protein